ncbi:MAG: ABC transporter permease [Pseudomonadota bacterium]
MTGWRSVFKREFKGYFATPLALVFILVFLVMTGIFTFFVGDFFARGQADLKAFFSFHPWLYLFLAPALAMRLWAEERRSGTLELLLTLPISTLGAVTGKFLAAWAFASVALALTFPLWLTVNLLGEPDNGVILASYLGSSLMLGAYLAIGSALSATTRNQVIAFVATASVSFLFTVAGLPLVLAAFQGWAPQGLVELIGALSFLSHFNAIEQGVIDARDVVYFASVIAVWLYATVIVVDAKKEAG